MENECDNVIKLKIQMYDRMIGRMVILRRRWGGEVQMKGVNRLFCVDSDD
jgi:hypothetical protein